MKKCVLCHKIKADSDFIKIPLLLHFNNDGDDRGSFCHDCREFLLEEKKEKE